jgi:uncharacterized linocin/CFP29 family protein
MKNQIVSPFTADFFPNSIMRSLMANGMKLDDPSMRVNATLLRKDEWLALDNNLIELRDKWLGGVNDLIQRGLTYDLGNIGVSIAEWERINDITDATVSMSPRTGAQEDTVSFDIDGVPVPLIHKDFRFDIRRLTAARNNGSQLDTTQQMAAGKKVFEAVEDMLFNGYASLTFKSYTIYGYRTFPDRATGSLTADWDGTATGEQMVADVIAMLAKMDTLRAKGPFVLYVPIAWMDPFREDFKANSDKTVLQRILQFEEIEKVQPTEALTSDVVLVEMSRQTVDLAVASDIVNVPWETLGGFEQRFKVIGSMVPRLKVDGRGDCAIVHYS